MIIIHNGAYQNRFYLSNCSIQIKVGIFFYIYFVLIISLQKYGIIFFIDFVLLCHINIFLENYKLTFFDWIFSKNGYVVIPYCPANRVWQI